MGLKHKWLSRLRVVFEFSLSQYLPLLTGLVLSWLTVYFYSEDLWGEFVSFHIYVNLFISLVSFGNQEYILKRFSSKSNLIKEVWLNSFFSRGVLLFLLIPIALLLSYSSTILFALCLWAASGFVASSYQVLVVYSKKFRPVIIAESVGFLLFLLFLFLINYKLDIEYLLLIRAISHFFRSVVLVLVFWKDMPLNSLSKPSLHYFRKAFPFFLLSIIGLISTKIDLYLVTFYSANSVIGQYHIYIMLVTILHSSVRLVINPFVKNIYRLKSYSLVKLVRRLSVIGLLIVIPGLLIIYAVLISLYEIDYPFIYYFISGLYIYASFISSVYVYILFRRDQESTVLIINSLTILINFSLCIAFIREFSILGVLIAGAIAQWIFTVMVFTLTRKKLDNS